MQKISESSCYYYYGKQWDSWDQLRANFRWEIPGQMNTAFYVCDSHAENRDAVAIYHENISGAKGTITFWELKNITKLKKAKGEIMTKNEQILQEE